MQLPCLRTISRDAKLCLRPVGFVSYYSSGMAVPLGARTGVNAIFEPRWAAHRPTCPLCRGTAVAPAASCEAMEAGMLPGQVPARVHHTVQEPSSAYLVAGA